MEIQLHSIAEAPKNKTNTQRLNKKYLTKGDIILFIVAPYLFGVGNSIEEAATKEATTKKNVHQKNNNNMDKDCGR